MLSVSAIVLTKDSERTIESCLKALLPAVNYVTVVDTGSTDNTVQIAKDCGARVYHFEWRDDFAAARNFGDSLATTDWVIHVDSDEILHHEDVDKIRKACALYKKTNVPVVVSWQLLDMYKGSMYVQKIARMYKRGVLIWKGIIHEHLTGRRTQDFYMVDSDFRFVHDGYDPNVVNTREKYLRNIRLLKKALEQEPDNPRYHFHLGRDYTNIGEYQLAVPHLRLAVNALSDKDNPSYRILVHRTLISCLEAIGDKVGAEEVANRMVGQF